MPKSPKNPYTPPVAIPGSGVVVDCYRQGSDLLVQAGGSLPERCPVTGQEVTDPALRIVRPISWTPSWIYGTGFLGILPMVVLMMLMRKRATISLSLSHDGKRRFTIKRVRALACGVCGLALFLTAVLSGRADLFIPGTTGVMLIILSGILLFLAEPLRCVGYKDGWFSIGGCSVRFLRSVPPFPEEPGKEV